MATTVRFLSCLALLPMIVVVGCGSESNPSQEGAVDRELGAAYFAEERYDRARESLARVVELPGSTAVDRVNLACVELADPEGDLTRAHTWLDDAARQNSDVAALAYARGVLAMRERRLDDAAASFERTLELAPEDLPARLNLAQAYDELGRRDDASAVYSVIVDDSDDEDEQRGSWSLTATYRLGQILTRAEDEAEQTRGLELLRRHREWTDSGIRAANYLELELGELCRVRAPRPAPRVPAAASSALAVAFEPLPERLFPDALEIRALRAAHLNADDRVDLLALTADGIAVAFGRPAAGHDTRVLAEGDWIRVVAGDLDNDGTAELLALDRGGVATLLASGDAGWRVWNSDPLDTLELRDVVLADLDHEGDLDLLAVTAEGVVVLRNDGRPEGAAPGEVTLTLLPSPDGWPSGDFSWAAVEDFDNDNDIDVVVGGPDGPTLIASSLRGGRWELLDPSRSGLPETLAATPLLADLDHDGMVDALFADRAAWARNRGDGTFEPAVSLALAGAAAGDERAALADVDLDGELDMVLVDGTGQLRVLAGSLVAGEGAVLDTGVRQPVGAQPLVTDLDGDGDPDLAGVTDDGVQIHRGQTTSAGVLRVLLEGRKDNRDGIGAVVEVRAGEMYQRRMATGRQLVFGFGPSTRAEVVRVTWPNGVSQQVLEPEPGVPVELPQREGLIGSCPFLYAWNGEEYEFISDVLGITPLGLPMVEGQYVAPDHDELIRVEGRQLRPVDGEYRLFVTEELREVTYLDRAQLWVVDHAAGVELHPEERFTFPPFPPQRIHAIEQSVPLVRALGSDGRDWTAELSELDAVHAAPFEPLPPQFLGLVTPHHLDLELPPEAVQADRVRLMMTGWLHWTDASVNVAAGHHDEYEFVPPMLMVPDGRGGWRPTGPPVGFPAGKTKTMVLDIGDLIVRDDPRIRVVSTIRLYWDQIHVAIGDDAPFTVTKIEPSSAQLQYRGFSRRQPGLLPGAPEHDQPEWFDFEAREPWPRWNQHDGMFTRYGQVLPLLHTIDDRFAIFAAGDAIDLRFPVGSTAPPSARGGDRTYLLFLDGWAKDGDHNTSQAQTVEPLPFHGMSGYPYRSDEHYPDDEAHRRYRAEWNTRPGVQLRSNLATGDPPAALRGSQ